jgi:hypothetical protein
MTEDKTITMNGNEYNIDEVSEKAKYLVSQLKDLQTQATQLRGRLDQVDVCSRGFTQLLEQELENPEQTEG